MPRVCTICTHAHRAEIDKALVENVPFRNIAERFGTSTTALTRHKAEHLPATLVQAARAQDEADAIDVMAELGRCLRRVNLLFDACDRWLRDPEQPDQYDIGPRAADVQVTYSVLGDDGKRQRRKAGLQELLSRLAAEPYTVERWEYKHADPRELVLKTVAQLNSSLELLAKLEGKLQQEGTVNILVAPAWLEVRTVLMTTLAPFPEARTAVAQALLAVEP